MKPSKKNAKRRRKASKSSAAAPAAPDPSESMEKTLVEEKGALDRISETFASVSLDRITVACETGGESCKAAEILGAQLQNAGGDRVVQKKGVGPRRRSRVVAASGMVSDVIGKSYSKHLGNCCEGRKDVVDKKVYRVEEAEQFLCSMLGWDDQLGMGVVKDVLGEDFCPKCCADF